MPISLIDLSYSITSVFFGGYYNHALDEHRRGTYTTVTDAYCSICKHVMEKFNSKEVYHNVINSLYIYAQNNCQIPPISIVEYMDQIVANFCPSDHVKKITADQKNKLFAYAINNIYTRVIHYLLKDGLKYVIDGVLPKNEAIELVRKKVLDICKDVKDWSFAQFVVPGISQDNALILKLRDALQKEIDKNNKFKEAVEKQNSHIKHLNEMLKKLIAEKQELQKQILIKPVYQPLQNVPIYQAPQHNVPVFQPQNVSTTQTYQPQQVPVQPPIQQDDEEFAPVETVEETKAKLRARMTSKKKKTDIDFEDIDVL